MGGEREGERGQTLGGVSELGSLVPFCTTADDLRTLFFSAAPDFFIVIISLLRFFFVFPFLLLLIYS